MPNSSVTVFNAEQTAQLLDFPGLLDALAIATVEYVNGAIHAPERQALPFPQGGVMLSMPATAHDIGIHKLVNVVPGNRVRDLPTISGIVSVYDGQTGQAQFVLDGPTVTARRTAAVSMLGLKTFLPRDPECVVLVGTGTQSVGHVIALAAIFPGLQVIVVGTSPEKAQAFVDAHHHLPLHLRGATAVPHDADAVITLTTSATPVYTQPAKAGVLIIGVGAFRPELAEIGANTLMSSQIYVDDPAGARHEAGDLIQANVDWTRVRSLSDALTGGVRHDEPIVFKTVGCAAWDLAAARCALRAINL